jgi:hypothetical protein
VKYYDEISQERHKSMTLNCAWVTNHRFSCSVCNRHLAKSASEKLWSSKEEDAEYQRPKSGVYHKFLKMRLTACRCEVLGDTCKPAHKHTYNWMSGLVAVRNMRESIMLRYPFWSTCSPSSSASNVAVTPVFLKKTECISYVCQDHNFTHVIDSWV